MIDPKVHSRLIELQDLPTLPEVMSKLLESVANEGTSAQEIADLLASDHAISARVLRLANSAFYSLRPPVDSIKRAVVVTGFDAVKNLALATSVFDAFSQRRQSALDVRDFWLHSLGTAHAAKLISTRLRIVNSPEGCFTAGLLHDIGKYVLAMVMKTEYVDIVTKAQGTEKPLREVEQNQLNTTHTDVGNWLAEKWRFPEMISDVITHLYNLSEYDGQYPSEVAIVSLADQMSRMAGFGNAGDMDNPNFSQEALDSIGIEEDSLSDLCKELEEMLEETQETLEQMHR